MAHPGRLAAAQLQSTQDKVGEGEAAWDVTDTPASAKSYYLRVLKMGASQGSMRNLREMTTLCTILDHFALGRTRQAADTIAQRFKAVEMACADGHHVGESPAPGASAAGFYPSDLEVGGVPGSAGAEAQGEGGREHSRRQHFHKLLEGARQRQGRLQGKPLRTGRTSGATLGGRGPRPGSLWGKGQGPEGQGLRQGQAGRQREAAPGEGAECRRVRPQGPETQTTLGNIYIYV